MSCGCASRLQSKRCNVHDIATHGSHSGDAPVARISPSFHRGAGSSSPWESAARQSPPRSLRRVRAPAAGLWRGGAGTRSRLCRRRRLICDQARRRHRAKPLQGARDRGPFNFLVKASLGLDPSLATFAGMSLSITSASGATARTSVIVTASRRGVEYVVASLLPRKLRLRSPASMPDAKASPIAFSAFGGSSSVRSSTSSVSARHAGSVTLPSMGNPSASRDSTYACATRRDSVRIRPIYPARSVTDIAPRASSRLKVWAALRIIS